MQFFIKTCNFSLKKRQKSDFLAVLKIYVILRQSINQLILTIIIKLMKNFKTFFFAIMTFCFCTVAFSGKTMAQNIVISGEFIEEGEFVCSIVVATGANCRIEWGDLDNTDFIGNGSISVFKHFYTPGTFNITFIGDYEDQYIELHIGNSYEIFTISEIDLSEAPALKRFSCPRCQLTSIDLSPHTELNYLVLDHNKLTTLDLSANTKLKEIFCVNNQLTSLDVTSLTELVDLEFSDNKLTAIDVSANTKLEILDCDNNQLVAINLTGLDALTDFRGSGQKVNLTLTNNGSGEYLHNITLNEPTFTPEGAISYAAGVLKSTDNTVTSTSFKVKTGNSKYNLSGIMEFEYKEAGGIETNTNASMRVYPNPTTGQLTIDCRDALQCVFTNVEIYDIMGKKQFSIVNRSSGRSKLSEANSQFSIEKIDISDLSNGIYFVRIHTENEIISKKIIKN